MRVNRSQYNAKVAELRDRNETNRLVIKASGIDGRTGAWYADIEIKSTTPRGLVLSTIFQRNRTNAS